MDFLELAQKRYSCKKYDGREVEEAKLNVILQAGQAAPTAKNLQEHHVYVIRSAEGLEKVDQVTPCRYGAPVCLLVTYNKNNVFCYPGGKVDSGREDATIVATHLMLAAASVGVDSCWLNNFNPDKAAEVFGLPEEEEPVMILDLGYAAEGVAPLPNHSSRKALSETVSYL